MLVALQNDADLTVTSQELVSASCDTSVIVTSVYILKDFFLLHSFSKLPKT